MPRVDHLTGATVDTAPPPCRSCMWWQTRPGREPAERDRFIAETEDEFGPWGKIYREDDRVIGLIQYGPAAAFPRAATMPAGPPAQGCGCDHLRVSDRRQQPLGTAEPGARGDRRVQRSWMAGAGGIWLSVRPWGIVSDPVSPPPNNLPAGLPGRLRVSADARFGQSAADETRPANSRILAGGQPAGTDQVPAGRASADSRPRCVEPVTAQGRMPDNQRHEGAHSEQPSDRELLELCARVTGRHSHRCTTGTASRRTRWLYGSCATVISRPMWCRTRFSRCGEKPRYLIRHEDRHRHGF